MDKTKFLIAEKPIARAVTFNDGTKETLHFRQVSAGEFRRWQQAESSEEPDVKLFAAQRLIAVSLCEKDGKLALSEKESLGLTMQGVNDLFPHVLAVAGFDDAAKKDSPSAEPTGSVTP